MVLTFEVGERAWFPKAWPQQQQKSARARQSPALAGFMAEVSPIRHLVRFMLEEDREHYFHMRSENKEISFSNGLD